MKENQGTIRPTTSYERLVQQEDEEKAASTSPSISRYHYPNFYIYGLILMIILASVLLISCINIVLKKPAIYSRCQNPALRQEWRMLSTESRQNNIRAVQCLSHSPSRLGLNSSRYDDFVFAHLAMFNTTISLPWHRWCIQHYENALREECGYEGYLAYWDWTLGSSTPTLSPIFSNTPGFGENGSSPSYCLNMGPLSNMQPQYPSPRCLARNFHFISEDDEDEKKEGKKGGEQEKGFVAQIVEDLVTNKKTYYEFRRGQEDGPHRWIHRGI